VPAPFRIETTVVVFDSASSWLRLDAALVITEEWAEYAGAKRAGGAVIGRLVAEAQLTIADTGDDGGDGQPVYVEHAAGVRGVTPTSGPDLLVGDLQTVKRWSPSKGDITAYSFGTAVCNIGDEWSNWAGNSMDHPVVAQNIYRLKEGRFEQIGMSWARHGVFPGSGTLCSGSGGCTIDLSGRHLGVGCSDIHSSDLNGAQSALGPRSQVNAATGVIEWPFSATDAQLAIDRRVQVHQADLDPAINSGAAYFIEGQLVAADDSAAGTELNNASYRTVEVTESAPSVYRINPTGRTQRGKPAIMAWESIDPEVTVQSVDVPGDGRFILASKVTALGDSTWHYEYALANFSSDQSGQRFSVPVAYGVGISNVGFHDVDEHSGSMHGTTDWSARVENGSVLWATEAYDADNPYANALGWGTLYNFRFDAESCPTQGEVELGLYKPGTVSSVRIPTSVPSPPIRVTQTNPPSGAVDARQPFDIDSSSRAGWQTIDFSFSTCAAAITKNHFTVAQQGPGLAPFVERVDHVDDATLTVVLSDPISVGTWTTVAHTPSGDGVTIAHLPADVDGDGTSSTRDLITLIDVVSNQDYSLPLFSTDIDRSRQVDLGDIIRLIDLLTGAGAYDPYMSATLQ
ncbi:MAG: hypothetical protein ACE5HE_14050, partial [Phycisphaerae bacterium]